MIRYAASVLRQPGSTAPVIERPETVVRAPPLAPVVPATRSKMERIVEDVAYHMGVPINEMYSDRRHREYARARQAAMWVTVKTTPFPLTMIGRHFRRDHTTVMHGVRLIDNLRTRDTNLAGLLDAIAARHQTQKATA